jgi:hypothetical protein
VYFFVGQQPTSHRRTFSFPRHWQEKVMSSNCFHEAQNTRSSSDHRFSNYYSIWIWVFSLWKEMGFMICLVSTQNYELDFCGHLAMNHCVTFLSLWQDTEIISLKRGKVYFWLTVSEVSVHDWLAHCFGACGETVHHGGIMWQRRPIHFMVAKKQRQRARWQAPVSPSRPHTH